MRQMVEKILNTHGTTVKLEGNGEVRQVRAFFQPVRSKSWSYLSGEYSPLGEVSRGQYVYIGPVEPRAEAGDAVTVGDRQYWLRRSEVIYHRGQPVYCWGMCVEKGGEDTWGRS